MKRALLFLLVCWSCSAFGQLNTAKMDSLFDQLNKYNKFMGSVALSTNGKVDYAKAIGYLDVEQNITAHENTLYHIGSLSKMFTAVLIMQLIEDQKLTQETKLSTFFPTLPNADSITIAQMLNHSSGLHNFTDDSVYLSYMEKPQRDVDLIKRFEQQPSDFKPGAQHEYSNTAYVVLSMIIEKITKKSYNEVLQEKICKKIGLENTRIADKINPKEGIAYSYTREGNEWKRSTQTDMSIPKGAGAIISTATDMCLFMEALFSNKLISEASLNQMTTIEQGYGKGLFQFPFGRKKAYGHTGSIDAFEAYIGYFPEDKKVFCLLGNAYNYDANQVAIGLLSIAYNLPYTIPTFEKKVLADGAKQTLYGKYHSDKIGMTIKVSEEGGKIMAQAEGQSAFPLTKVSDTEYTFEQAGITMTFNKNNQGEYISMILKQNGLFLNFDKTE